MDQLDTLLEQSAPRVAASVELDRITSVVTHRKSRRVLIIAMIVGLSLGGATAAAAGTGTLDDIVDYYLSGDIPRHNDHAWEMDITGVDGTQHCYGGIVVMPFETNAGYDEARYLAIKKFVQNHDWSNLQPDPSLLHPGQRATAEHLAITADRHMIVVAEEAGFSLESIETRGYAECAPK